MGRAVAVGLMISGIALLGTVTATLAAWFSERVRSEEKATHTLESEVALLRQDIAVLTAALADSNRPTDTELQLPTPGVSPASDIGNGSD